MAKKSKAEKILTKTTNWKKNPISAEKENEFWKISAFQTGTTHNKLATLKERPVLIKTSTARLKLLSKQSQFQIFHKDLIEDRCC